MSRYVLRLSVAIILGSWAVVPGRAASIPIENASFEAPIVDPNGFGAVPLVDGWTEIDVDTEAGTNTGVFLNTPADSPDHVANADGLQLAFLGSQQGNALEQDLADTYKVGREYRLTVGVGVSMRFPPSAVAPVDNLQLVLYYRDGNEPVDVASRTVAATGLSATQLRDFTLYLPKVESDDAWAGKTIGVAIRAAGAAGGFWDLDNVRLTESLPVSIPIENASFESPVVDPNGFGAVPIVDGWTEIDLDTQASSNTGVFLNTAQDSPDHVANADGLQLAFLGSQQGNALEQDLAATYKAGAVYRLTVGVGVSMRFPPSGEAPVDNLELVLYYRDGNEPVDVASQTVAATGLSSTQLQDFSVELPTVEPNDAWAGKTIGVAIRAAGAAGGFWDLDNAQLTESLPASIPITNASFESPVVDPNGFGAVPFVESWTEIDVDTEASTNTGVFLNTAADSPDHVANADGLQLAFLGSQQGNGLEQDLAATYKAGSAYRLTVGVGVSMRFPPSTEAPVDNLELVLYYRDGNEPVDVASQTVAATGLSATQLQDFSVYLPTVEPNEAWAGKTIGVAIRAAGAPGGFWDLDNVRLGESLPPADFMPADKE
jgi:HpiC1 cyclase